MLRSMLKNALARSPAAAPPGPEAASEEAALRFEAAKTHLVAGRTEEAAAICRSLLAADPNYSPAHLMLAGIELPGEDYFAMLARIHAHLKPRTYVEIGVFVGQSLQLVAPETTAIGVDPNPRLAFEPPPNVTLVERTSDDFFALHDVRRELGGRPVDLAFIDGMHRFEFALRDFMNLERLCSPASTILIHDVYPLDERTAARERVTGFWSGDVWRLVPLLRRHRPDLVVRTIATRPSGLAVVRNLDPASTYIRDHLDALVDEYLNVGFEVLEGRKAEALALVPNDWAEVRALLDMPVRGEAGLPAAR